MVSINPNFQGRVVGNPKTIATPQKEDAQPQVQTQQLQAPAQPKTSVQPQEATPDNESLLAFNGIKINKPEKPVEADEGVSSKASYSLDSFEELSKFKRSGILKPGDKVAVTFNYYFGEVYLYFRVDDDGKLVFDK